MCVCVCAFLHRYTVLSVNFSVCVCVQVCVGLSLGKKCVCVCVPADWASGRAVDVTARRSDQERGDLDPSCPTSNEPCSTGTSMTRAVGRAAQHTHIHEHSQTCTLLHTLGLETEMPQNASVRKKKALTSGENKP